MLDHLEKHNVLTSLNHGFRSGYSCETQLAITIDDLLRSYDKGQQIDIAILDFSKAFDTVPHRKLLHKLDHYGIRGPLHRWLSSFLCKRQMRVVVGGEYSRCATVDSGVPQGTVLGPLLFLCHINDLPDCVKSQVRLFADDCLLYRTIKSQKDHLILQNDLSELDKWAKSWGMRFNAKKCYILSVRNKSSYFYNLNGHILKYVQNNPYLGLIVSDDLKWNTHITSISKKASSMLGFLRRNLKHCNLSCRKNAYISLVRSTLEYGAIIWDPFQQMNIDKLERIQNRAIRFISNNYKDREPGTITNLLRENHIPLLKDRRKNLRLLFLFKIAKGLTPAIRSDTYLVPERPKRSIKPKQFKDFTCHNIVERYASMNTRCFKLPHSNTDLYKYSLFPRTIVDWNNLDEDIVNASTVDAFKVALQCY